MSASRLLPFSELEVRAAMDNVKLRRSKGTDLSMGHPRFCPEGPEILQAAQEGVIFFHSPIQLEGAFLFAKVDAGRGLLGRQKAAFPSFVCGDLYLDSWQAGATFTSWITAITSIGNIYRGSGFR